MGKLLVALDFLVNLGGPFLVYHLAEGHMSTTAALIWSSTPPIIWSVVQLLRSRTLDAMSMLVIAGIALSLIATLLGGSPRLLLIRESFITGIFGLIFLGSLLFPRPLLFQLVKTTVAKQGTDAESLCLEVVNARLPLHVLPHDHSVGNRLGGRGNIENRTRFFLADWRIPRDFTRTRVRHLFWFNGLVLLVRQPAQESR